MSNVKVTKEQIDSIISSSKIEDIKIGEKNNSCCMHYEKRLCYCRVFFMC